MNLARFLTESRVDMDLGESFDDEHAATHETLTAHMASLLATSPDIGNPTKLQIDLVNRERQAPSLLGNGVALPHVRTMQARKPVMAIGICREGLAMGAPDGRPVRLVIAIVAPPYDDRLYLVAYKRLGENLSTEGWIDRVVASEVPGEVLRALAH